MLVLDRQSLDKSCVGLCVREHWPIWSLSKGWNDQHILPTVYLCSCHTSDVILCWCSLCQTPLWFSGIVMKVQQNQNHLTQVKVHLCKVHLWSCVLPRDRNVSLVLLDYIGSFYCPKTDQGISREKQAVRRSIFNAEMSHINQSVSKCIWVLSKVQYRYASKHSTSECEKCLSQRKQALRYSEQRWERDYMFFFVTGCMCNAHSTKGPTTIKW